MSDLDQLKDMGFEAERANLALKAGGNLNGAIDWLDKNSEKSTEELKEEAAAEEGPKVEAKALEGEAVAKSWVCNECGKKFRSHGEMQFHANKSGHTDMAESTEEIAPLTEEERKAKLEAMRQKLAAKRAVLSDQDKEDKKKNEEIRRKATQESQDIREQLQVKERIKDAEKKRREKKEDELARKRVLDQIKQDREDRKRKAEAEKAAREGRAVEAEAPAAPSTPVASASKPAGAYTETRLRLQTPSGNLMKSFPVETTLFEVAFALKEESGLEVQSFSTNFPKKTFDTSDFGMTLKEAGMIPSAALIVR